MKPGLPAACAALLLCACRTARPADPLTRGAAQRVADSPPAVPIPGTTQDASGAEADLRRRELLTQAGGGQDILPEAMRADDYGGSVQAGEAVEAYAAGKGLKALLLAQAAVGADPGNGARRKLLEALEKETGMKADPEGLLPLRALVYLELKRADEAFFAERFGAAIQSCRRALLLSPDDHEAWMRLGSAHYALGEQGRAKAAYQRALELDPKDVPLKAFLKARGWLEKQ